jgi:hypothetical protein
MALQLGDSACIDEHEGEVPEFSSPACSMHEVSDQYMGYADPNEVTAFLNELLEAERAGPSDLRERIAFLNRGQGWVVRKLREMLPRVRDDRLHVDLSAMLRSHEVNIDLANDAGK